MLTYLTVLKNILPILKNTDSVIYGMKQFLNYESIKGYGIINHNITTDSSSI